MLYTCIRINFGLTADVYMCVCNVIHEYGDSFLRRALTCNGWIICIRMCVCNVLHTHTHTHTHVHTRAGVEAALPSTKSLYIHTYIHACMHTYTHSNILIPVLHSPKANVQELQLCWNLYKRAVRARYYSQVHEALQARIQGAQSACVYVRVCMHVCADINHRYMKPSKRGYKGRNLHVFM